MLDNDSIGDGLTVTAIVVDSPQHGTLSLNPDGSFTYTPNADANGSDSFTYQATDGTATSNVATVALTVNPINDAPAAVGDAYVTDENTALTVAAPGLLINDTDIDGDTLSTALVLDPSSGSLTLNADGSFSYTPNPGFSGSDSFTYRAEDGIVGSNVATVTITVLSVNKTPTADAGGPYSVDEGGTVAVNATGSDAEDASLSFIWDLDGDGIFETPGQTTTFPATDLDGPATRTIAVQVSDDDGGVATDVADVTIRNVAPTAAFNAPSTVDEGSAITLALTDPSDPSTDDALAGFSYAFDCDDGTGYGAFSTSPSEICPTSDDGARTVKGKVRDKDGGETEYSAAVMIANVAPRITLDGAATVDEGGVYTVTLRAVADPGNDNVSAYIIDWGDGSTETVGEIGDLSHVYADGPSNPTIAVDLTDEDGTHSDAGTLAITVNNVAPVIDPLTLTNAAGQVLGTDTDIVVVGMEVDLTSLFTDVGGQDTHTATIDWGDQSSSVDINPAASPIIASHTFDSVGTFTIALTVVDDDGASATQSAVVNVVDPVTATAAVVDDLTALAREKPNLALFATLSLLRGNNGRAANNGALALLEGDPGAALVKLGMALTVLAFAPDSDTVANAEYVLTSVARAVALQHQAEAIVALGSNPSKGEQKQLDRIADDIATGDRFLANGAYPKAVSIYTGALWRALDLLVTRESQGWRWPPRSTPR
ncbi:MAG: tandem-95 repeat protein [Thermomicrobiales bacterium]|nr:tandem-95 repeat protein [Thermomicrobiales bacterium]